MTMTSEQFQRVKELFAALEPLSAQERQRALEAASSDDSVVRAQVEKLLERNDEALGGLGNVAEQIDSIPATVRGGAGAMTGQRVGPYQVVEILGQGGMGVVYLAHDTRLARKAALKAILPGAEHDAMALERLRREARVLAALSHPNLATVYGLEESHGTLFLAMEYIEGKSLSQRLGRSAMPISEALHCCQQIAAGLEAAHEEGVIHRDLKPGNVMFTAEGIVKVLDFGLARELHEKEAIPTGDAGMLTLTREGSVLGTPAYMSPEQARGEPLDRRTDIFSFGSILFRCLAGRPAFGGETVAELIDAIVTHEPDWSKLPASLPAMPSAFRPAISSTGLRKSSDQRSAPSDERAQIRASECPPVDAGRPQPRASLYVPRVRCDSVLVGVIFIGNGRRIASTLRCHLSY